MNGESENRITTTYEYFGKTRSLVYIKTDFFCPNCGEKSVYEEDVDGDVYLGADHFCVSCNHRFYLPGGTEHTTGNDYDSMKYNALKSVIKSVSSE